ncbi:DUF2800 domain-containing protein [Paenibacillus pasadenensis]|uniref:DUF2800 domain-containing protein n=1 Tax=Paenibacillus pasadenensis TaxID=217090 RepID=UPI0004291ECD
MGLTPAHAERGHALLGASKASQWINCPPSARAQEGIPDTRSEFANEGTAAHELSELILRSRLLGEMLDEAIAAFKRTSPYYNAEMEAAVAAYVEVVEERFMAAKARSADAAILFEAWLDFSAWVPEGFGTGDVVLIADGVMEVIDLKYGKGVPVSAIDNPQIRLYGLGAWSDYSYLYDIREVHGTIVQPRLDSVSTEALPIGELLQWAETVVKPAAVLAHAGKGDFAAGDHCRWCKIKGSCRARADANMAALAYEFRDPVTLSLEEIGSILHVAEQLSAWAKDVSDYAFTATKAGQQVPGWKLVEGRSDRKITDKNQAIQLFSEAGLVPEKYLKPPEILGIGKLESSIGKKELVEILGGLIVKPPGKPALVPETDKRPELNSVEGDFEGEDF